MLICSFFCFLGVCCFSHTKYVEFLGPFFRLRHLLASLFAYNFRDADPSDLDGWLLGRRLLLQLWGLGEETSQSTLKDIEGCQQQQQQQTQFQVQIVMYLHSFRYFMVKIWMLFLTIIFAALNALNCDKGLSADETNENGCVCVRREWLCKCNECINPTGRSFCFAFRSFY